MKRKKCSSCDKKRSVSQFSKDKRTKDGLRYTCNKCRKEKRKKYKARELLYDAKRRAKKKKIPFELTEDWVEERLKENRCEATGRKFDLDTHEAYSYNPYSPSLDRLDSSKGYTEKNCQLVCWFVNSMKSEYTKKDFKKFIKILFESYYD